ncbi:MAG: hypothetical protein AAF999_08085 [Pseudomonadota bacterium]
MALIFAKRPLAQSQRIGAFVRKAATASRRQFTGTGRRWVGALGFGPGFSGQ